MTLKQFGVGGGWGVSAAWISSVQARLFSTETRFSFTLCTQTCDKISDLVWSKIFLAKQFAHKLSNNWNCLPAILAAAFQLFGFCSSSFSASDSKFCWDASIFRCLFAFNYSSLKVGGSLTHETAPVRGGYRVKSGFAEFDDGLNYGTTVLRWFDSGLN